MQIKADSKGSRQPSTTHHRAAMNSRLRKDPKTGSKPKVLATAKLKSSLGD